MDTDLRDNDLRADHARSRGCADAQFALRERVLISALVAGVNLWIRLVEIIPDSRRGVSRDEM
jgi:hypothetical protein